MQLYFARFLSVTLFCNLKDSKENKKSDSEVLNRLLKENQKDKEEVLQLISQSETDWLKVVKKENKTL